MGHPELRMLHRELYLGSYSSIGGHLKLYECYTYAEPDMWHLAQHIIPHDKE